MKMPELHPQPKVNKICIGGTVLICIFWGAMMPEICFFFLYDAMWTMSVES